MTGNTTTVLIGLGLISVVLPIGLLVLFRVNRTIEREHPSSPGPALTQRPPAAEIPSQRAASAAEAGGPTARTGAKAGSATG